MSAAAPAAPHAYGPAFLALVADARTRVRTCAIEEFIERLRRGEQFVLIDVREDHEWAAGHLPGAHHLGRGIIEREIEAALPEKDTPIVCYSGGGERGVLAADSLGRMGYGSVISLDGGWRGWNARGLPMVLPGA